MSDQAMSNFQEHLSHTAANVTRALDTLLSEKAQTGEIARPVHLMAAMRHGALNGGKRLRPFLVLECAKLFSAEQSAALQVATALECIHCYSLIHDDLPAMDDDDLRRGEPTVHIQFDEATAILAGDGLLTLAFDILSQDTLNLSANQKLKLISLLAKAAGIGGMVGGQALDLAAEKNQPNETDIIQLQQMKTGALIRYACEAGAIIGQANQQEFETLSAFGKLIGQAFQLADDLLDVTSDTETMGKKTGKDADKGKATLVGLHGIEWATKRLNELSDEASSLLDQMPQNTATLGTCAEFIIRRSS